MNVSTPQKFVGKVRHLLVLFLLIGSALTSFAQNVSVKGKVTDDQGQALPGVSVVLKGTTTGSVSDNGGNYSVSVPNGTGTLVFSFIGYVSQEIAIDKRSSINISLATDLKTLNEVVVVGYGVQKKETVTGSVATVKGAGTGEITSQLTSRTRLLVGWRV